MMFAGLEMGSAAAVHAAVSPLPQRAAFLEAAFQSWCINLILQEERKGGKRWGEGVREGGRTGRAGEDPQLPSLQPADMGSVGQCGAVRGRCGQCGADGEPTKPRDLKPG